MYGNDRNADSLYLMDSLYTFYIHVPESSFTASILQDFERDRLEIQCKGCSPNTIKDQDVRDVERRVHGSDNKKEEGPFARPRN